MPFELDSENAGMLRNRDLQAAAWQNGVGVLWRKDEKTQSIRQAKRVLSVLISKHGLQHLPSTFSEKGSVPLVVSLVFFLQFNP